MWSGDSPLTVRCTQLPLWKVSYCCSSIRTLHSYQPWSSERTGSICREAFPCREALPADRGEGNTRIKQHCLFILFCFLRHMHALFQQRPAPPLKVTPRRFAGHRSFIAVGGKYSVIQDPYNKSSLMKVITFSFSLSPL